MVLKRKEYKMIKGIIKSYSKTSKKKKIILIAIGIFILLILLRLIVGGRKYNYKDNNAERKIPVIVSTASNSLVRDIIYLTARLEPQSEVNVFSSCARVAGQFVC